MSFTANITREPPTSSRTRYPELLPHDGMDDEDGDQMATPKAGDGFELNQAVTNSFPIPNTKLLQAVRYGSSLLNQTAKVTVQLASGEEASYFLKVSTRGEKGRMMLEGEYESLKAITSVSPTYAPKPLAFGEYMGSEIDSDSKTSFLLEEFRTIKTQPASPTTLGKLLANLHNKSQSPSGQFGFHIKTYHGKIPQNIDNWTTSWASLFTALIKPYLDLALSNRIFKDMCPNWQSKSSILSNLLLDKVIPRLLLPLQSNNRTLKPCLLHGDCWDGNTAEDPYSKPFLFDACSFYGHNEYDTGNWRAVRHKLSDEAYIQAYKKDFPVSEPAEDWDARNRLYSLTFNIGNALYIPGSEQAEVVYKDMETLCQTFCPDDLSTATAELHTAASAAT